MSIINEIKKKASGLKKRIIFPENDARVLKAIEIAKKEGFIEQVIIDDYNFKKYAEYYSKKLNVSISDALTALKNPLNYSACAVALGDADAMIAGAVYTSAEVISTCHKLIGVKGTFSSFFLIELPGRDLIYADCAVIPTPTSEQLADIAVSTGNSAAKLNIVPRIAMLSFSTHGSAKTAETEKVVKAVQIAKQKCNYDIDGELQPDAALDLAVARKKMKLNNVAGKANVLIFPDLNSGNIAYKLTQILAKANAYGPILQGFEKPVSDLSRGCSVEDIVGVIAIISVLCNK